MLSSSAQRLEQAQRHHQAGDLSNAENLYREVLKDEPDNPVALHLLGLLAHQSGSNEGAMKLINQALTIQPDYAEAHNNLGLILQNENRLDEAVECFNKALELNPDYPDAHSNLGLARHYQGRPMAAVQSYQRALELAPNFYLAHANMGNALGELGQLAEAAESYQKALNIEPNFAEVHNYLGTTQLKLGQVGAAIESFRKSTSLLPDFPDGFNNLGLALQTQNKYEEAIPCHRRALSINPKYAEAHNNLGTAQEALDQPEEAIASYKKAIDHAPDFKEAYLNLGELYEKTHKFEEAKTQLDKALEISPDYAAAKIALAAVLRRQGQTQEGIEKLEALDGDNLDEAESCKRHFELGTLYDLAENSEQAFEHFAQANKLQDKIENVEGKAKEYRGDMEALAALLKPEVINSWIKDDAAPADETPIFLVGFPRSGTTLLDQIIDAHNGLQVMEERPALLQVAAKMKDLQGAYPEGLASLENADVEKLRKEYFTLVDGYIEREEDTVLVDKFPLNIYYLPLIMRLFPGAHIILALRHPCDVVLSNFMQNYTLNRAMANFLDWRSSAMLYNRVMALWLKCEKLLPLNFHTIKYEDLLGDFETEVQKLIDFLPVEWDDEVLDYRQKFKIAVLSTRRVTGRSQNHFMIAPAIAGGAMKNNSIQSCRI